MSNKYLTQYKTYDSLIADIQDDLNFLDEERYITPDKYIKVAQTCNKKLSVKINPIKEDLITIKKGLNKLPDDFYLLDKLFMCTSYYELDYTSEFQKFASKNVSYTFKDVERNCSFNGQNSISLSFAVRKRQINKWINVTSLSTVRIEDSINCVNSKIKTNSYTPYSIKIIRQGEDLYLESNFDAEVYIIFVSKMQDDEGNLLVLDNPAVNEYYEYAIKARIYEELWLNGIEEYANKLSYVNEKLRVATIDALNYARMVDFADLKQVYFDNRKRMYLRYDKIIQE